MDIVLIPAYFRPEFLALCLEYLSKAEGARDNKEYWVCQDFREHDDARHSIEARWTKDVIESSPLPVRFVQRKPHNFPGNSYNTLEAYKDAYMTDARFVYLVEEDVIVTPDFFLWHEAIHTVEPETMCSIGYRCSRNPEVRKDISDPSAYFTSRKDYASIGVCWRREHLDVVVEHAHPGYYMNMGGYLDARFPRDVYSGWFHEQDGAIMRVMHEQYAFTCWPVNPRAFHVGGYGYHRPGGRRPDGQLTAKIDTLRQWIHDAEILKVVAPDFGDIEPVPQDMHYSWEKLHKVQEF